MSLKYIDSNGASHVVSGMTPGGNLETGAVAIREGNIELPSLVVGANTYSVSFSSPMPDDNYEIYVEAIAGFPYNSGSILLIPYHNNEKTANGFKMLVYNNTGGTVAAGLSLYYKAFKLYEVADAEALYSDVTDIKSYIPSNASSSNKLSTANDLRTETRSLDRRIDDLEDVVPSDAGISNMLVTQDDLSGVEIDKVEDINDVELTSIQDGQTLIWDATNSKWVNGQGGKTYSAGNGINISGADEISTNTDNTSVVIGNNKELKVADTYKTTFVGTTAAWEALSAADKAKYTLVSLTDDAYGSAGVTDAVTDGDMRPVTSNAVYDGLATKQNSTDNSLTTTAKTIAGAINEHDVELTTNTGSFTSQVVSFEDYTLRKYGNVVSFTFTANLTAASADTWTVCGNLPAAYRPNTTTFGVVCDAWNHVSIISVGANGNINLYKDNGQGLYSYCNLTWIKT